MGYIVNYRRWRAMHEAAIFEAKGIEPQPLASGGKTFANPASLTGFSEIIIELKERFEPMLNSDNALKKILTNISIHLIDEAYSKNSPGGDVRGNLINLGNAGKKVDLFYYLFGAATAKLSSKERESIPTSDISLEMAGTLKLTPHKDGDQYVASLGAPSIVGNPTSIVSPDKPVRSWYGDVKQYMNRYNIHANILSSSNGQYDGSEAMMKEGRIDFSTTPAPAGNGTIYLFTPSTTKAGAAVRKEEDIIKEIAGIPVEKKQANVSFVRGSSALEDAGKAQITNLMQTILDRFAGKTIETFELISSASPEWDGGETMASYAGKTTSGTGDPGAGKDFASKNAKLAYDRGVSFMTELNSQLKAKGHPGFDKYTIKWQISDKGGPDPANQGRFVDLNLATNESKPKIEKVGTKISGEEAASTKTGGVESFEMVIWKFTVKHPVKQEKSKKGAAAAATPGEAPAEEATAQ